MGTYHIPTFRSFGTLSSSAVRKTSFGEAGAWAARLLAACGGRGGSGATAGVGGKLSAVWAVAPELAERLNAMRTRPARIAAFSGRSGPAKIRRLLPIRNYWQW